MALQLFYNSGYTREDNPPRLSMRCPACHQRGTFAHFSGVVDQYIDGTHLSGQRVCPNPQCRAQVFVVYTALGLVSSYPPERIDFDAINIPAPILAAFEEAIACHANQCYVAGAIMVRKTLEELCRDKKASGKNLKDRLKDLRTSQKVVLPDALLDGMDDLRLLGNDAAHVESEEFNHIGQDEVEVGIEFTREILKAVYQMSALLGRLRALKKS